MSPISFLAGWLAGVIEKSRLYCHYTEFWLCMLIVIFDCCFGLCVVTWLHLIRFSATTASQVIFSYYCQPSDWLEMHTGFLHQSSDYLG